MKKIISIIILLLLPLLLIGQNLTPIEFGFLEAQTDKQRYDVLLKTHQEARERGLGVSYEGVPDFSLTVTHETKSIPLSDYTDFAGVRITIANNSHNHTLFTLTQPLDSVFTNREQLNRGNFGKTKELRDGLKLLVIEDKIPWVYRRQGYAYGAQRRDILLLKNGRAINKPIYQYEEENSNPVFFYCNATPEQKVIKNVIINRAGDASHVTNFIRIEGTNNVQLSNIKINTPPSNLVADRAISILNSTNITIENVVIDGTYSLANKSGYGISMNNVWNSHFIRLHAFGNWGVFGTNNTNHVSMEDSFINRFDIHCYGRDVFFKNTVFMNLYNQFSSLYGKLRFDNCQFINFVPVLFETSYSAYSYFELEFANCILQVDKERPYLIRAGNPSQLAYKFRKEFSKVEWPDIKIDGLIVNMPEGVKNWTLFQLSGNNDAKISALSHITVDGLIIKAGNKRPIVKLTNKKIKLTNPLKIQLSNSNISSIEQYE